MIELEQPSSNRDGKTVRAAREGPLYYSSGVTREEPEQKARNTLLPATDTQTQERLMVNEWREKRPGTKWSSK